MSDSMLNQTQNAHNQGFDQPKQDPPRDSQEGENLAGNNDQNRESPQSYQGPANDHDQGSDDDHDQSDGANDGGADIQMTAAEPTIEPVENQQQTRNGYVSRIRCFQSCIDWFYIGFNVFPVRIQRLLELIFVKLLYPASLTLTVEVLSELLDGSYFGTSTSHNVTPVKDSLSMFPFVDGFEIPRRIGIGSGQQLKPFEIALCIIFVVYSCFYLNNEMGGELSVAGVMKALFRNEKLHCGFCIGLIGKLLSYYQVIGNLSSREIFVAIGMCIVLAVDIVCYVFFGESFQTLNGNFNNENIV